MNGSVNGLSRPRDELETLLGRVARQDADAFATFYDLTKARVYGLVLRILRDAGYSQETTQEVFVHVWRNAAKYDPSAGSAMAWLMTVAHGRAVERVRSEEAGRRREDRYGAATVDRPADDVADAVIGGEDRRRVADCLGSLTDVQRECIELAYYRGLTYPEVSARLSANLSTVKSRIRDALRGLRNCLAAS
ncbi:ECF RNA polymerase sigma factor SigK [Mycolicibacterium sphagni]|nr:ECF RNA polymerase sigma factor SigK [Mycolicibacterium sphagni]MCV7177581.1 ECF RNA polymerase sigma factor SigK [Mycolicibacterium sphagni]